MRAILICICLFFSYSIAKCQNIDIKLLHSINSNNSSSWDRANKVFSQSMSPVSIATPTCLFLYGLVKHDSIAKRNSYVIAAAFLISGGITTGLKYSVNRPRPFVSYPLLIEKKSNAGNPSFPSGHTSSAFCTATSLSLAYPKWYIIAPSFLWACAVSYSRMELGVHYPSDVLSGALIGTTSAWLTWKINKRLLQRRSQ